MYPADQKRMGARFRRLSAHERMGKRSYRCSWLALALHLVALLTVQLLGGH